MNPSRGNPQFLQPITPPTKRPAPTVLKTPEPKKLCPSGTKPYTITFAPMPFKATTVPQTPITAPKSLTYSKPVGANPVVLPTTPISFSKKQLHGQSNPPQKTTGPTKDCNAALKNQNQSSNQKSQAAIPKTQVIQVSVVKSPPKTPYLTSFNIFLIKNALTNKGNLFFLKVSLLPVEPF